jgi:hypothetical protein
MGRHLPSKSSPYQPVRDLWVHSVGMFMSGEEVFFTSYPLQQSFSRSGFLHVFLRIFKR